MGHSKLPWKTDGMHAYGWDMNSGDLWVGTVHGSHGRSNGFPSDLEGEANANLIVTAVNVMPEVIGLLRDIVSENIPGVQFRAKALLKKLEAVDGN